MTREQAAMRRSAAGQACDAALKTAYDAMVVRDKFRAEMVRAFEHRTLSEVKSNQDFIPPVRDAFDEAEGELTRALADLDVKRRAVMKANRDFLATQPSNITKLELIK